MIIGIDGSLLNGNMGGTGWYTHRLLAALSAEAPECRFIVYCPAPLQNVPHGANVETRVLSTPPFLPRHLRYLWWLTVCLPRRLSADNVEILHCPYFLGPLTKSRARIVLSIHDAGPLAAPHLDTRSSRLKFRLLVPRAARVADAIISGSESAKNDVVSHLGLPADRVWVIPNGTDTDHPAPITASQRNDVRTKYAASSPYLLFVGNLEPRKNIPTLIRAYARLKSEHGIPHKLVIAGKKGWMYGPIFDAATETGLDGNVVFTGYVPQEDLPSLYAGASLFAFPSWYEGFGLPVIEAMARGTPVVASNIPALAELVGDAGLLVDPSSPDDLAAAMWTLLTDADLRRSLVSKGLARSSCFSWSKTARGTLEVYRAVWRS